MTKSLLPPKGIMAQTALLFEHNISPALRDTWLQLRALAWGAQETPELSMPQLEALTGKKARTLYAHLKEAREISLLAWRVSTRKSIIISFPEEEELCKILQTLNILSIDTSKDMKIKESATLQNSAKKTCPQKWMIALYDLCGQGNGAATSPAMRRRISEAGKALMAIGAQVADVANFGVWWYANDWRGKRGSAPTPEQVRDSWHAFKVAGRPTQSTNARIYT